MSIDVVPERAAWSDTLPPTFTVTERGQLVWVEHGDEVLADVERRGGPSGSMVLRQVWNADRSRLRRLVIECDWHGGPLVFAEARRPRSGWSGDEAARLLLSVLTLGVVGV